MQVVWQQLRTASNVNNTVYGERALALRRALQRSEARSAQELDYINMPIVLPVGPGRIVKRMSLQVTQPIQMINSARVRETSRNYTHSIRLEGPWDDG